MKMPGPANRGKRPIRLCIASIIFLVILAVFVRTIFVAAQVPSVWGPDIRVTNTMGDSRRLSLAIGPNRNLYLTFDATPTGYSQIFFTELDSNGGVILPMSRVSFDADYAQRPDITVDANNDAFIFWDEVKDNTALKWEIHGEKVRGANGRELVHRQITLNSMSLFASADVDRRTGEVYLTFSVWGDYLLTPLGVPAMYFAKFDNNFNDIISPRAVLDGNGRRLLGNHVDIAVGPDGLVHAARETLIPPNYGSYIRLNPNGQLVGSETIFRGPGTRLQEVTPFKPALAIDSQNNAHIVFTTPTFMVGGAIPGGHAVYMKVRNGQVVVSPVRIYNNPDNLDGGAEDIAIATDEQGKAHIVVRVRTYQGNFFKLLYYVINADGSVTPPVDLGLSTTMPAEKPSIASREGKVFAGWNDYRNGNMELYLKIKSG